VDRKDGRVACIAGTASSVVRIPSPKITDNKNTLVVFLKDMTFVEDPKYEMFDAGYVAICDRLPNEDFFIAILYHEWFIIENNPI
jgi:hypothetical protein